MNKYNNNKDKHNNYFKHTVNTYYKQVKSI